MLNPRIYRSPNHDRARPATHGIILHSTRSGLVSRELEYERTVAYMLMQDTVSSHRVIGILEGQHAQMVADDDRAWHAQEDNLYWLAIEHAQPRPGDPYSDWQIETSVQVSAAWCRKYDLVPSAETIRRHGDTAQGIRNGKSDPGLIFPYLEYIARVQAAL